jgi:hypothetical protein
VEADGDRVIPLTVTAILDTAPVVDRPLYLDALLLAAIGERMGADRPDGWAAEADVIAASLPLARVESPYGWWWAASAVTPRGPEAPGHLNRVPLVEEAGRWTAQRSLNQAAGPDKRLRKPYYSRPAMLSLTWTCVGEPREVAELLTRIAGVGALRGHGHGWVRGWTVEPGGPPLAAYASDVTLRHLPAELRVRLDGDVARRQIPLRPPYHRRRDAVPCWQVQR